MTRPTRARAAALALALLGVVPTACTAVLDVERLRDDPARAVVPASSSGGSSGSSGSGGETGASTITRGLLAYWAFDETSGDVAIDSSPMRNDGVLHARTGAKPTRTTGKRGGALTFRDGAYVEVTKPVQVTSQLTIAFWVNASSIATMDQPRLFSQSAAQGAGYIVKLNGRGMQLSIGNSFKVVDYDLPDNEWHHFAVVFDGAATWYVDGAVVTASSGAFSGKERVGQVDGPFRMAVASDLTSPFSGSLDDVRIHDVALSDAEVRAIFEGR